MTKPNAIILPALVVLALWATSSRAQVPGRFQLFNDCKPIGLVVGKVFNDLQSLGIAEKNVQAAAESRLRAARLYTNNAPAFLYVAAGRYAIQLQYRKPLRDIASGETRSLQTFSKSATVPNGTAAGVMLEVSKLLDLFLVDYLRVNESACGQASAAGGALRAKKEVPLKSEEGPGTEPSKEIEPVANSPGIRWGRSWPVPEEPEEAGPEVHHIGGEVTSPRLLYKVEPEYSTKARKAGLEGTVMLAIEVWEDGKAHNIRVLRSLEMGLDEKAVKAVEQWRFKPGMKDGEPVKVAAQVQVTFRLLEPPL